MKILITGINGMVASYLAELLLKRGHEVIGTKRWQEDDSNIRHIKDKIKLVDMNVNDLRNCINVIAREKPDAISHLAAESYVSDSFEHPRVSIETNGLGTYNLLEAIRIIRDRAKMFDISKPKSMELDEAIEKKQLLIEKEWYDFNPIIHICSSSEVYGLVEEKDVPIKETQSFNPANPYACGKVLADVLARMYYTNYGLKTITTRMFTHTCARRRMLSAEVAFAKQIAEFEKDYEKRQCWDDTTDKYILKHGNLNSIRTWAHVEDACEAYYQILTNPKRFGEAYNIGGIDSRSIGEMLDYMISLSTIKDKIIKEQDSKLLRKYDVTLQLPDISKFRKDYPQWKPKWKFKDIIKDVLEGQRKNEN